MGYSGTSRLSKRGSVRCTASEGATAGGSGRAPPDAAPPTGTGIAADAAPDVDGVVDSVTEEAALGVGCDGLMVSILPDGGSRARSVSDADADSTGRPGVFGGVVRRDGAGATSRASAGGDAVRPRALLTAVAPETRGRPADRPCASTRPATDRVGASTVDGTPGAGTVGVASAAGTACGGVDGAGGSLFPLCHANTPKVMPAKALTDRSETRDNGQRRTSALKYMSTLDRSVVPEAGEGGKGVRVAVATS